MLLKRHGMPPLTGLNFWLLGFSMSLSFELLISVIFTTLVVSPMSNLYRFGLAYLCVLPLITMVAPLWGLVATMKGSVLMLKKFSSLNETMMLTNYPLTLLSLWFFSDKPLYSVYIYVLMLNKVTLSFFGSKVRQHFANPSFAST